MADITHATVRKDSAQSSLEGITKVPAQRAAASHLQHNNLFLGVGDSRYPNPPTFALKNYATNDHHTATADMVTNPDRAKSPTITRALSPLRMRRTPVLVNAPDVRWHLGSQVRPMPSFCSVISSATTSTSASTVPPTSASPQDIALPASVASPNLTILPEEADPVNVPLPPSPPLTSTSAPVIVTEGRPGEFPRPYRRLAFQPPHLLSPVTEASSGFSTRSISTSIVDFSIHDIATAEQYTVTDIHGPNVQELTVSATEQASPAVRSTVSLGSQQSRHSRFVERFEMDGAGAYAKSLQRGGANDSGVVVSGADGPGDERGLSVAEVEAKEYAELQRQKEERRWGRTFCGRVKRFGKGMKRGFEKVEAVCKCLVA